MEKAFASATRLHRGFWVLLVAAAAVCFMAALVALSYISAEEVRSALLDKAQRQTERRAGSLERFFFDRLDNLLELSNSRELKVYFENKALGMSMAYGLRQSLPPIREKLASLISSKQIGSVPVFLRIAIVEPDGSLLVDSSDPDGVAQEGPAFKRFLRPDFLNGELLPDAESRTLLVSAAHFFKGSFACQIVAWLNPDCVTKSFLVDERGSFSALFLKGSPLPVLGALPFPLDFTPQPGLSGDVRRVFERVAPDGGGPLLGICAPVAGSNFALVRMIPIDETLGRFKPWHLLLGMIAISVLVIALSALGVRMLLDSEILGVRLAEAEAKERAISAQNALLEAEVMERRRVQECFNILRMAMESIPFDRILRLAFDNISDIPWLASMRRCTVRLADGSSGELRQVACIGVEGLASSPCVAGTSACPCRLALLSRSASFVRSDEPAHPACCHVEGAHAHYAVPLVDGEAAIGVICLVFRSLERPESSAVRFIDALAGVLSFIIQRRRSDDELRRVHEANRILVNSIPMALVALDGERRIVRLNPFAEALFDKKSEALAGLPLESCGLKFDAASMSAGIAKAALDGRPAPAFECAFAKADGKSGILNVTACPISGAGMDLVAKSLLIAEDVTERKSMEAQLLLAQKLEAVGELAAGVAHEINTPVQYVSGNLEFLKESFSSLLAFVDEIAACAGASDGKEKARKAAEAFDLDFIKKDVPKALAESSSGMTHVAEIVKALREFSHPSLDRRDMDLNKMIVSALTVSQNAWKYVAEMKTDLDESLPFVLCTPGEINQVFINIIVNAAHAIEEVVRSSGLKGLICIRSRQVGGMAEISVSDTGCGIPDSIKNKVYDPFFTTKAVGKGTGQGLPLARAIIVKKHGGELFFESEAGKGTVFFIRLPLRGKPEA